METKIGAKRVEMLRNTLGFAGCYAVDSDGLSGGIGLFWSNEVSVEIKNHSFNHIDALVQNSDLSSPKWRFTGFYGSLAWRTDTIAGGFFELCTQLIRVHGFVWEILTRPCMGRSILA
jgi:hypothetical protein